VIFQLIFKKLGCSGCCDCGDPDAWSIDGFCSDHKGFVNENELDVSILPKNYVTNIYEVYYALFY